MSETVTETNLPLRLFRRGKVRDTYELGDHLLMVSTDRVSAFDVVLPNPIPDKGRVLNLLSAFWFERTGHLVSDHLIAVLDSPAILAAYGLEAGRYAYLVGRSMVVKRARRLPVECVVRGYLSGSAWEEYRKGGTVQGLRLPPNLKESQALSQPLFTPTTKADSGHDLPLTDEELRKLVGDSLSREIEEKSLAVYNLSREYALGRGIIIADTKMEFGLWNGQLILIDELLTPDSSRFWDASQYKAGQAQPSFDKQPLRDWLTATGWNKEPPAPSLPPEIVQETANRYREAYSRLTGRRL